ncbi:ABC transporter ATP-binding protein [Aestuariimicrobium soli]|uniref:ABC transporter ATP-binding protein n=1 Tax=Aestuariimicrobium soli TaxID=2035834 RepID=UPI003EBEE83E
MNAAIEITDLTKRFGAVTALDGLTMSVATGDIHGFLGPNGAGKSTTIRVLLGLLRADSGSACLLGGDPWREAPTLHRRLAYVPGDVNLWPNLTGGEAIDLIGRARGGLDPARKRELVEAFDLDPRKKGRTYSKGNRQKVALVAALASDVDLLLLDEPTSGLDPLMERVFTDLLRREAAKGRTVLLSSHILSEVEALCDRVSIIKSGRIVESGTLAELRHLHRTEVVAHLPEAAATDDVTDGLVRLPGLHEASLEGRRFSAQVDDSALPALLARLAELGVTGLTSNPPSLEELFLAHYDTNQPVKQEVSA